MSIIDNVEVGKRIKQIRTEYFEKKLTQTEFGQLIDSAVKKAQFEIGKMGITYQIKNA